MPGELVAEEIKRIEHEKECGCVTCTVNQLFRLGNVVAKQSTCECPVCSEARDQIFAHINGVKRLADSYFEERERIEPLMESELYVAEHELEIRTLAGMAGAVITAARIITMIIGGYKDLVHAAHEAYSEIGRTAMVEYASDLKEILRSAKGTHSASLAELRARLGERNPRDVN